MIISNCVVNLAVDKAAVFAEMHRLLRPGGRVGMSDVVTEDRLTAAERAERGSYVGCIAGALSVSEYRAGWKLPASTDVSVESPMPSATASTRPSCVPSNRAGDVGPAA